MTQTQKIIVPNSFSINHFDNLNEYTKQPWLSIIIPAYNVERYIRSCIASIDPAKHQDIEIIIVDDGSTDSTLMICNQIAISYNNVSVIHKENGGSSSARNTGFKKVTGVWSWFIDADDLIAPGALNILKKIVSKSNSDALQINFVLFSDTKKPIWPSLSTFKEPNTISSEEFLRKIYNGKFKHFIWSFLLRTESLKQSGKNTSVLVEKRCSGFPFREDFSLYEDVVSIEKIMRCFKSIDVTDLPVYGYRQLTNSISQHQNSLTANSGLRAVREIARNRTPSTDMLAKTCMEISLLFSAYKLVEDNNRSLRQAIKHEIESRVKHVGLLKLGAPRLFRYLLLKTKILDVIIWLRERA